MSTSSNESEFDHLQCCGAWPNEIESPAPWYPTFGQPLIYYSQVQPCNRLQRIRETNNDKPNCFKKAFRWYTQEHMPFNNGCMDSSSNMKKTDVKNFAAWLDDKYNEFLQTSQIERTNYTLTQTSTIEIDNCEQFKRPVTKKYKRVKSPWKRRKKCANTKEKGDVLMKSNQSIEMIMKPKDLSRLASECCQRPKAQPCCNRSSSTVGCNASKHRVVKQKSQSSTSVKEREIHMIPFDIPDYCGKQNELEHANSSNHKIAKIDSGLKRKKYRPRHVSCQCSKYMHEKADANIQVEDKGIKGLNWKECPCQLNTQNELMISEANSSVTKTKTVSEYVMKIDETGLTAPSTSAENNRNTYLASVCNGVQTSGYSINLNQNMFPEYPLFMKIVCADKLKEN